MTGVTVRKGGRVWWQLGIAEITAPSAEIRLGEACRALDRYFEREAVTAKVTPAAVSRFLRQAGFEKVGMTGSGYDREPLYRRRAA